MSLAIHMGIFASELPTLQAQLLRVSPEMIELRDTGYTWSDWGKHHDLESDTVHVVLETRTPMVLLNLLANRYEQFLQPFRPEHESDDIPGGTKLFVTDGDDYGSSYWELCWPEVLG